MKRNVLKFLSLAILGLGCALVSCDDPNKGNEGNKPGTTTDGSFIIDENVPTPIRAFNLNSEAGDAGVSVEVTSVDYENFVFTCHTGAAVQSYKLDVYPLAMLYNSLYENMKMDGKTTLTEQEVNAYIESFLFSEEGGGGYGFGPVDDSDEAMAEFQNREFDWGNSKFKQFNIVPAAEYIIVAIGCFDNEAKDMGDMTITYIQTPAKEPVGQPSCTIHTSTNFTTAGLTFYPEADCKYISYYCSTQDDLMPYINAYGWDQFINIMRHYMDVCVANHAEGHQFVFSPNDLDAALMATAICMDENKTPYGDVIVEVFHIKEREDIIPDSEFSLSVDAVKTSATCVWYDYSMDKEYKRIFCRAYTKDDYEGMFDGMSDEELQAWSMALYNDGAWVLPNNNFKYDYASDTVMGEGDEGRNFMNEMKPGEEYVIVYAGRDMKDRFTTPKATEPFTMDAMTVGTPEACESTLVMELEATGVTSVDIQATVSHDNTAIYYWQYIEGFSDGTAPSQDAGQEAWVNWLMALNGVATTNGNIWWTTPGMSFDSFEDFACQPGTKYTIAYVAEDWNGVMSDVKFASATTPVLVGGANPTVKMEGKVVQFDGADMIQFTGSMVSDCKSMYFYVLASDDSEYINSYMKPRYEGTSNDYSVKYPDMKDTIIADWISIITTNGQADFGTSQTYDPSTGLYGNTLSADNVLVGIALGIGEDSEGKEVFSEPAILIWDTEKFRTLDSYYE